MSPLWVRDALDAAVAGAGLSAVGQGVDVFRVAVGDHALRPRSSMRAT